MSKNNTIETFPPPKKKKSPSKSLMKFLKMRRSQKENIKSTQILTSEIFYYLSFHEFLAKKLLVGFYYFSVIQKAISFSRDN